MASKKDPITAQRTKLLNQAMHESEDDLDDGSPINVELFPCSGGFSEGFKRAGVTFDIAIEFMPNHCDSYQINIGHRPVCMDARDFLRMLRLGLFKRHVKLLVADPPCTPWSRSGKREGINDDRDMLENTCEIIRLLQPDVYLIGNVPGLDDGPNLHIVQRVIGGLAKHGYCSADYARLDAANYGVPQHRVRPFWFGHKDGPCIQWPEPTHGDPLDLRDQLTLPGVHALLPWVTCGQALAHLTGDDLGRPVKLRKRSCNGKQHGSIAERPARVVGTSNLSDGNVVLPTVGRGAPVEPGTVTVNGENHTMSETGAPARTLTRNTHGDGSILINDKHRPSSDDAPSHTIGAKARGQSGQSGQVVTITSERKVSSKHPAIASDKPATTLRGGGEGHSAPEVVVEIAPPVFSVEPHHPPSQHDEPAMTVRAGGGGGANRTMQLDGEAPRRKGRKRDEGRPGQGMRTGSPDQPSDTVTAKSPRVGAGAANVLEWPWDRPATTVQRDERLAPPGHKDENWSGGIMSLPNAVVISEKAAAVLQGFPDGWLFVGATKRERFSQLGQAMPPPLAHAVATAVVRQHAATLVALARQDVIPLQIGKAKAPR